jgi:hypothetical protein
MLILIFTIVPMATCRAAVFEASGSVNQSSGSFSNSLDNFFNSTANGAIPQGTTQYLNESEVYTFRGFGTASSGNDGLKANASASVRTAAPIGNSQLFVFSTSTFAGAEWSDFIITGPNNLATVPISLNLEIDGTFATSTISTPSGRSGANSQVQIVVINDDNRFGGFFSQTTSNGGSATFSSSGLLVGFDGDSAITTPLFNVPVNTPFTIILQLSLSAGVFAPANEISDMTASATFSNTFKISTSGPAFNLPAGYTINSAEAGIVDNVSIPETSSFLLAALGTGSLVLLRTGARRIRRA